MLSRECEARARLQIFLKSNRRRSLGEVYRDKNSPGTVLGGVMRKTGVVALEAPFRTIRSETHIMPRRIREAFEYVNTVSHVQDRASTDALSNKPRVCFACRLRLMMSSLACQDEARPNVKEWLDPNGESSPPPLRGYGVTDFA
jgi:hypothetical protein